MNYFSIRSLNDMMQAVGNVVAPMPEEYEYEEADNKDVYDDKSIFEKDNREYIAVQSRNRSVDTQIVADSEDSLDDMSDVVPPPSSSEDIVAIPEDICVDSKREADMISDLTGVLDGDAHARGDPVDFNALEQSCRKIVHLERELENQKSKTSAAFSEISSLSDDLRTALRDASEADTKFRAAEQQSYEWKRKCEELERAKVYEQQGGIAPHHAGEAHHVNSIGNDHGQGLVELETCLRTLFDAANLIRSADTLAGGPSAPPGPIVGRQTERAEEWTTQVVSATDILLNLKEQLHSRECEIVELKEMLVTRDLSDTRTFQADISLLQREVETRVHEVSMLEQLLSQKSYDELHMKEQLTGKESALQNIRHQMAHTEPSDAILHQKLCDMKSWATGLGEQLREKDLQISQLQSNLENLQSVIRLTNEEILQTKLSGSELRQQLAAKDDMLTSLEQQLAQLKMARFQLAPMLDSDVAVAPAVVDSSAVDIESTMVLKEQLKSCSTDLEVEKERRAANECVILSLREDLEALVSERDTLMAKVKEIEDLLTASITRRSELEATLQGMTIANTSEKVISDQKQIIRKLETEARQLHQVIAQLRNVRKNTQDTVDSAIADRNSQKELIDRLKQELSDMRDAVNEYNRCVAENISLRDEVSDLREKMATIRVKYEERVCELEDEYVEAHEKLSEAERAQYDLHAQLDLTLSDLKICQQDMAIKGRELDNVLSALESLERDKAAMMRRSEETHSEKMQRAQKEWALRLDEIKREHEEYETTSRTMMKELEEQLEGEILLRRKLEIDVSTEKRKMNKTLEHALKQLQNSQADSVDRVLVKNLILTYFRQKRSPEVLRLIANILGFDVDERIAVGLEVPQGSLLSSLFSTITSPLKVVQPMAATPVDIEGDNLAEMWLNFLIHESDTIPSTASTAHQSHQSNRLKMVSEAEVKSPMAESSIDPSRDTSPSSPHRSYAGPCFPGSSAADMLEQISSRKDPGSGSSSAISRRMPQLIGASSLHLALPPPSPPRDGCGDPTGFKLVPQSPVFSGEDYSVKDKVEIQSNNKTNIW